MGECKNYVLIMSAHSKEGAWSGNTLEVISYSKNGQFVAARTSPEGGCWYSVKEAVIDPEKEFTNAY